MKILRSATTMNGKFEASSNNYDKSNLNRLHTVPGPGVIGLSRRRSEAGHRPPVRDLQVW